MALLVEGLPEDATTIGLTTGAIEIAVRSRLRAARIYSEDYSETAWSFLYVTVNLFGPAFSINVNYKKDVKDLATMLEHRATTWNTGSVGTHGREPNFILSSVAQYADEFIDEYLRVNAGACK